MSALLTQYNKGLKAKASILQVRNFNFSPRKDVVAQIQSLGTAVERGFQLDTFPDANDSISNCGLWVKKQYKKLCEAKIDDLKLDDVLNPIEPQSEDELTTFFAHDAKMTQLLASAINKWLKDANTYEEARQASAALQLRNADVPEELIADLIQKPEELRKFIQQQRSVLVAQLQKIKTKIEANDAMDMPTQKELLLYNKHKSWFESDATGENNPYPNDNAVVYSFLILEIFMVIWSNKSEKVGPIWQAYEGFCKIFIGANKKDSNTKAWDALKACPDYNLVGFNVGKAMREYVSDEKRCAKSTKATNAPKLQSGLQRGPRRLDRIVSISVDCHSQFTILNLDGVRLVQNLVELYSREQKATAAVAQAKTVKKGAEGLSDAESIAWLCCLGRVRMLPIATGRNDCSLPKLVGALVNIDTTAFAGLKPRPWSVTIRGQ
jgi:hypothetical protein